MQANAHTTSMNQGQSVVAIVIIHQWCLPPVVGARVAVVIRHADLDMTGIFFWDGIEDCASGANNFIHPRVKPIKA